MTTPLSPPSPDLTCPLCDYNLTGLTTPQCPECGHTFEWDELTNPARRRHKWFFEHRRFLRGYLSTQLRLLHPTRFFTTVRPSYLLFPMRAVLFMS